MRLIWLAVCAVIMAGTSGCGGNATSTSPVTSSSAQFGIVSGNWGFSMFSVGTTLFVANGGGNLIQNGTIISGIIHLSGSPCFDPITDDLVVTGTASEVTARTGSITLTTAPIRGQTITFISSTLISPIAEQNQVLSGTFTLDGGTCAPGTKGPMSAALVTSAAGNWKGTLTPSLQGATPLSATATLAQNGPDAHGFFQISGSLAITGSPCFTSGTITSGSLLGWNANLTITTNDGGQMVFSPQLPSLATSSGLHGPYQIVTGACSFDSGDGVLTKQP
jgi:hypothetical protein